MSTTLRDSLASAMLELGTVYNALTVGRSMPDDGQLQAVLDTVASGGNPDILKGAMSWLVLANGRALQLSSMEQMYAELDHDIQIARLVWRQIAPALVHSDVQGIQALMERHVNAIQFMGQP